MTKTDMHIIALISGSMMADTFGLSLEPIEDPLPWAPKQYGHAKNHRVGGDTKASKRNSPRFARTKFGTLRRKR